MKKYVLAMLLFSAALSVSAQTKKENIAALNEVFSDSLLKYNFRHKATDEGLYLTQLKAGSPEKDERGPFSYFIEFIKWSDISSVMPKPGTFRGLVLVIYGDSKKYIFSKTQNDLTYDSRSYKFLQDQSSMSIFFTLSSEYPSMNKMEKLINAIRKQ